MNLAYDNLGRPTSISRYQGPSESLGYGSDLRLSSLGYSFADTSKNVTLSYTYNLAGQPMSATASNAAYRNTSARVAATYASDGLNRMTSTTGTMLIHDALDRLNQVVSGVSLKYPESRSHGRRSGWQSHCNDIRTCL